MQVSPRELRRCVGERVVGGLIDANELCGEGVGWDLGGDVL